MKASTNFSNQKHRFWIILPSIVMLGFLSGCFQYFYKVNRSETLTSESLQNMQESGKYFILHDGVNVWQMEDVKIGNNLLSGQINRLPEIRRATTITQSKRYKRSSQLYILNEVHIYANHRVRFDSVAQIPLNSLEKIEIYSPDKGLTFASWAAGVIGVAGSAVVLATIIFPAGNSTPPPPPPPSSGSSSCPFIFTYNGDQLNFAGEIYSGAIFPPLERDDYLRLSEIKPIENSYRILMSNQAREIQHTNLTELYIIDHPKNAVGFIDKYGKPYTCSQIQPPTSAIDFKGNSLSELLNSADDISYQSVPSAKDDDEMDEVILTFKVPQKSTQGKLILRARNSLLLDYSYSKYLEMFGDKLLGWQQKVSKRSPGNLQKWSIKQGIPMSVYLEKKGVWEFQDHFETPGPMAFKYDILKIDLTGIDDPDIKIKLKAGKLFWEIDRVGMDFSADNKIDIKVVKPFMATDQNSLDVLPLVINDDSNYFVQPEIGDEAELLFQVPELENSHSRTVFLHSRGHYQILGDQNLTQTNNRFKILRKPASFTRFAQDNYYNLLKNAMN